MVWRLIEATIVVMVLALGIRLAIEWVEPVLPSLAALGVIGGIFVLAARGGRSRQ